MSTRIHQTPQFARRQFLLLCIRPHPLLMFIIEFYHLVNTGVFVAKQHVESAESTVFICFRPLSNLDSTTIGV